MTWLAIRKSKGQLLERRWDWNKDQQFLGGWHSGWYDISIVSALYQHLQWIQHVIFDFESNHVLQFNGLCHLHTWMVLIFHNEPGKTPNYWSSAWENHSQAGFIMSFRGGLQIIELYESPLFLKRFAFSLQYIEPVPMILSFRWFSSFSRNGILRFLHVNLPWVYRKLQ